MKTVHANTTIGASQMVDHGLPETVHHVLDMTSSPTALLAGNNAMMIGVLHALREHDLSVPRDVAFDGFDDFEWSDLSSRG